MTAATARLPELVPPPPELPPRVAAVFMLREMEEVPSKEICATVHVSEANLWVMLHRARMALRECLEVHWFDRTAPNLSPRPR